MRVDIDKDHKPSEVYLLHFESPYWDDCRHYVGYTTVGVNERIARHVAGDGSLLVNYAHNKKGIPFQVGMVEPYVHRSIARWREQKLKKEGHLSRHCSVCKERKEAQ